MCCVVLIFHVSHCKDQYYIHVEASVLLMQCLVSSLRTYACSKKVIQFLFVFGYALNLNKCV